MFKLDYISVLKNPLPFPQWKYEHIPFPQWKYEHMLSKNTQEKTSVVTEENLNNSVISIMYTFLFHNKDSLKRSVKAENNRFK